MSVTSRNARQREARRAAEESLLAAIETTRAAIRATARAAATDGERSKRIGLAHRCVAVALQALTCAVRFL